MFCGDGQQCFYHLFLNLEVLSPLGFSGASSGVLFLRPLWSCWDSLDPLGTWVLNKYYLWKLLGPLGNLLETLGSSYDKTSFKKTGKTFCPILPEMAALREY